MKDENDHMAPLYGLAIPEPAVGLDNSQDPDHAPDPPDALPGLATPEPVAVAVVYDSPASTIQGSPPRLGGKASEEGGNLGTRPDLVYERNGSESDRPFPDKVTEAKVAARAQAAHGQLGGQEPYMTQAQPSPLPEPELMLMWEPRWTPWVPLTPLPHLPPLPPLLRSPPVAPCTCPLLALLVFVMSSYLLCCRPRRPPVMVVDSATHKTDQAPLEQVHV